jgi:hypothetical protein
MPSFSLWPFSTILHKCHELSWYYNLTSAGYVIAAICESDNDKYSHVTSELECTCLFAFEPPDGLIYLKESASLNAVTHIYYNLHNRYKFRFHTRKHAAVYKYKRTSLEPLK